MNENNLHCFIALLIFSLGCVLTYIAISNKYGTNHFYIVKIVERKEDLEPAIQEDENIDYIFDSDFLPYEWIMDPTSTATL